MKLKVFTLRLDAATGTFDDAPLAAFLAEREALAVQEHFFVHEQTPTWALLVSYRDVPRPGEQDWRAGRRRDWGAELADEERPAFDAIRRWRAERARRDGKPAYLLLTNRQVFDFVRVRPPRAGRAAPAVSNVRAGPLPQRVATASDMAHGRVSQQPRAASPRRSSQTAPPIPHPATPCGFRCDRSARGPTTRPGRAGRRPPGRAGRGPARTPRPGRAGRQQREVDPGFVRRLRVGDGSAAGRGQRRPGRRRCHSGPAGMRLFGCLRRPRPWGVSPWPTTWRSAPTAAGLRSSGLATTSPGRLVAAPSSAPSLRARRRSSRVPGRGQSQR